MKTTLSLNYRGIEENTTKDNKTYYTYYFEDAKGVGVSFNSSEQYKLEKDKFYNVCFEIPNLYFKGFAK